MRCTYCQHAKETIPEQLRYMYCSKFQKEVSVTAEFDECQYKESREYKIKQAIQNFCNDENNWIVAIKQYDLLIHLYKMFSVPKFTDDIMAARAFDKEVFSILNESKVKLEHAELRQSIDNDGGETRQTLLILQKPEK